MVSQKIDVFSVHVWLSVLNLDRMQRGLAKPILSSIRAVVCNMLLKYSVKDLILESVLIIVSKFTIYVYVYIYFSRFQAASSDWHFLLQYVIL